MKTVEWLLLNQVLLIMTGTKDSATGMIHINFCPRSSHRLVGIRAKGVCKLTDRIFLFFLVPFRVCSEFWGQLIL